MKNLHSNEFDSTEGPVESGQRQLRILNVKFKNWEYGREGKATTEETSEKEDEQFKIRFYCAACGNVQQWRYNCRRL